MNTNRIELKLSLYTQENIPHAIQVNRKDKNIVERNSLSKLMNGYCSFTKVRISAVTSHFPNG